MYEIELRTHPTLGISEVLAKVREFRNKNGDLLTALEYYHEDISNFTMTEVGKLGLKYKCHKLDVMSDFVSYLINFWKQVYDMGDKVVDITKKVTRGFDKFHSFAEIQNEFGNLEVSNFGIGEHFIRTAWERAFVKTRVAPLDDKDGPMFQIIDIAVPTYYNDFGYEAHYSIPLSFLGVDIRNCPEFKIFIN